MNSYMVREFLFEWSVTSIYLFVFLFNQAKEGLFGGLRVASNEDGVLTVIERDLIAVMSCQND